MKCLTWRSRVGLRVGLRELGCQHVHGHRHAQARRVRHLGPRQVDWHWHRPRRVRNHMALKFKPEFSACATPRPLESQHGVLGCTTMHACLPVHEGAPWSLQKGAGE